MTRWQTGEAVVEQLIASRELQVVTGPAADGGPGLARSRQTLASAHVLLADDHANAFVLAYDAVRQACTAARSSTPPTPTRPSTRTKPPKPCDWPVT